MERTYHDEFIEEVARKIEFKDKVILEIGCGTGKVVRNIAEKYNPKKIIGIDLDLDYWSIRECKGDNYEIREGDICELDFPDNYFDSIITVGTFEHINNLELALQNSKRMLKPFGKLFSQFSPIYTSIIGHHYNFWIKDETQIIPPWGHLWMSEEEMFNYLKNNIDENKCKQICERIYKNPMINRLTRNQYYKIFQESGFWIRELNEALCFNRQCNFGGRESELTDEIKRKLLEKNYRIEDIGVNGFSVLMEKYVNEI